MLWSLVAVGVTGILLGSCFRAPALIVVTAVTVVISAVAGGTDGLFDRHRLISILLLVVTQHDRVVDVRTEAATSSATGITDASYNVTLPFRSTRVAREPARPLPAQNQLQSPRGCRGMQ